MACTTIELADRLGVTSRRVLQLEHENVLNRAHSLEWNAVFSSEDADTLAEQLGRLAKSLDAGMNRMAGIDDIEARRKLGLEVGPLIGQFSEAMDLANATAPPGQRALLRDYAGFLVGRAIGQFLELMRWNIAEDEIEPSPARKKGSRSKGR
jgi:hypothetical protein